jgi:hypothetical protein
MCIAYAGLYGIITVLRPFRIAAAIALSAKTERVLVHIEDRFAVSRGTAIAIKFGLGWVFHIFCLTSGVMLASTLSAVPIFPS